MNYKKKIFILIIASLPVLASCKKEKPGLSDVPVPEIISFKDIKASSAFDWRTTNEIVINIVPLPTPIPITNTLVVKTENGDVLFSKLQTMGEPFFDKISVPSVLTKLVFSFGTISVTKPILNKQIDFNYLNN